ncbi:hypothetical protein I302_102810 [Kwoniella bestiolae CBS 10118]|uniref:Phosducin thioredoxin-like domain-containing protein n=1 Tax=Kwoniella bestiolae CBS 10118 TaxID=1296100 RepID=A0A1B9GG88_9TREE|nr:hypothetical protein I302_01505 [Kwoniella bestiolae CBS 10118]OCF29988.1 hypothetical protein I302_01505 [Kwoniella bestiolae CBS 10118]
MPDSLETAALNGSLFTFDDSPPSPARSNSSASLLNTDDELGSDLDDGPSSSKIGQRGDISGRGVPQVNSQVEHDGPQTGPKGVISDRKAHSTIQQQRKDRELQDRVMEQNRNAIVGLTVHEEDRLRKQQEEERELDEWRRRRKEQLMRKSEGDSEEEEIGGRRESVKRGGVRELDKNTFLDGVERVGWVVVLIYEPEIPRCVSLIASLLHLALNLPSPSTLSIPITLFKARATSLQFSLLPPTSSSTVQYEDEDPVGRPDPDVLPTMLVYKNGELEKNWVRVDWEVDEGGVEGLLRREGILPTVGRMGGGVNRRST